MKSIRLIKLGIVLLATSCTASRVSTSTGNIAGFSKSPGKLVFQTGFEGTSRILPDAMNGHYVVNRMEGVDNTLQSKNNWITDMYDNPDAGQFMLEYTGGDSTRRTAKIITDPQNPKNHVLAFQIKDFWEASEHQFKARVQADIYQIKPGYKEFHQSVRVYLPEEMNALANYPGKINWLTISEFWNNEWWVETEKYGFRVTLGMGKREGPGDLCFILNGEDAGQKEVWNANKYDVKVPIGKWFTMEYYFKEGDKDTGRFFMAITPDGGQRQVVFNVANYTHNTHDVRPDGVTGYNPMKLYTSKELVTYMKDQGKTLQIYWDDFKLWKN